MADPSASARRRRKPAARSATPAKHPDRRFGVSLITAGVAALGLAGAVATAFFARRGTKPTGHAAPDLALDAPRPGAGDRAPEAFRPDPTAIPTAEERESLRPATGPATGFAADRGTTIQ